MNPLVIASYSFNSRETYMEQVAQWKFDYQFNAKLCRETRQAFREANRKASKNVSDWSLWRALEVARSDRAAAKHAATKMIEVRHAMKVEARRQWEEKHQTV